MTIYPPKQPTVDEVWAIRSDDEKILHNRITTLETDIRILHSRLERVVWSTDDRISAIEAIVQRLKDK